MRSGVRLAAMMPATRAVASTSPLGALPLFAAVKASGERTMIASAGAVVLCVAGARRFA